MLRTSAVDHVSPPLSGAKPGARWLDEAHKLDGQPTRLNSTDGGQAGLRFIPFQRTIEDFFTARNAMNGACAPLQSPATTATVNNGINECFFVLRRANYMVPARSASSFPLVPGRERAPA